MPAWLDNLLWLLAPTRVSTDFDPYTHFGTVVRYKVRPGRVKILEYITVDNRRPQDMEHLARLGGDHA